MKDEEGVSGMGWLRLNAYGVLIALLAVMTAVFTAIDPASDRFSVYLDRVSPGLWIWTATAFVGGVLMLFGFVTRRTFPELFGLAIITIGQCFQVYAWAVLAGLFTAGTQRTIVTLGILALTGWARIGGVWPRQATVVVLPGRNGQGAGRE